MSDMFEKGQGSQSYGGPKREEWRLRGHVESDHMESYSQDLGFYSELAMENYGAEKWPNLIII